MGGGGDNEVKETAQEKALAEVAAQQYREYRTNGVPLEDAMIQRTEQTAADYDKVAGQTNADIQQAGDSLKNQRIASTMESGVDASSGRAIMGSASDSRRVAVAGARAGVKSGQSVEDRELAGKQQMIAIGRGQATDSLNSMRQQAASAAGSAINDARLESESSNATGAAVGAAAGMGIAEYTRPATAQRVKQA